jgi:type I restriction enzyme S subunit
MSHPRYPKYKDSGVEWLGEVPEHWAILPLKRFAQIDSSGSYGADPNGEMILLPVATTAQIDKNGIFDVEKMPTRAFSDEEVQRYGCHDGDILVVKSSGSATNIISGKAGLVDAHTDQFVFSNFLLRVRPSLDVADPKFVFALLVSNLTRQRIQQMCSTTTYPNLQVGEYVSADLALPPMVEQRVIAGFLDREMKKIDALVEEQQRLIELLKEKRQAVISYAVTKGLNPDVPLKDSGIEWLGKTPGHWQIIRLGAIFREVNEEGIDGLSILSVSIHHGVSDKQLDEDELDRKVTRSADQTKYKKVAPGDLVYNMMRAWQGGFGTVTVSGMVSPAYVVARPIKQFSSQFVELLLRTSCAVEEMRRYSQGVTDFRLRLYWDNFKSIQIALPSYEEQEQILDYITSKTSAFDELTGKAKETISLLQERRTALISAAVTGKIDVRGLAKEDAA